MSRDAWMSMWSSRDGSHNYGAARQKFLGEEGSFCKEVEFWRFGTGRRFTLKNQISSPTRVDILAMAMQAELES